MTFYVDPNEGFGRCAEYILAHLRSKNLIAKVTNGVLFVGPRSKVDDDLRWLITDHTPELTALVAIDDFDVAWRAGTMLRQLTGLTWPCPVPMLYVSNAEPNEEDCGSCGELLDVGEGNSYCCGPCARAKDVALSLWLQRPATIPKVA